MATTILNVKKYFDSGTRKVTAKEFHAEWMQLTDQDKAEIMAGIDDGTFTYPDRAKA